jgi:hypothetical protein
MAIYNVGERDIDTVRVILASFGIFAANMADIDAMGVLDPEGHTRHILMTGNPTMGERNTGLNHTAQSGYLRTKPHTGTWSMKEIRWERGRKLRIIRRLFFFWGGERCKPGPNLGVVQLVVGRAPVGGDAALPKCPTAYMQMDLGIVPGAQESTAISNWFQDDIIAALNEAHPEENIDAKSIGVFYHSKLFRGRFVY